MFSTCICQAFTSVPPSDLTDVRSVGVPPSPRQGRWFSPGLATELHDPGGSAEQRQAFRVEEGQDLPRQPLHVKDGGGEETLEAAHSH